MRGFRPPGRLRSPRRDHRLRHRAGRHSRGEGDLRPGPKKYLVALGIDLEFKTSVEDVLNLYRRELVKVPPEFFEEFKAKLDVSNATDRAIRAVMKLHPKDELREIVAFFESPSGKAYLARRPDLTQDMARLGVEFGRQVNDRLVLELKRRNFMY
ncbi:MAG: DUF2059 domain-containing protein [Kiritimatiellia bacterium]